MRTHPWKWGGGLKSRLEARPRDLISIADMLTNCNSGWKLLLQANAQYLLGKREKNEKRKRSRAQTT